MRASASSPALHFLAGHLTQESRRITQGSNVFARAAEHNRSFNRGKHKTREGPSRRRERSAVRLRRLLQDGANRHPVPARHAGGVMEAERGGRKGFARRRVPPPADRIGAVVRKPARRLFETRLRQSSKLVTPWVR